MASEGPVMDLARERARLARLEEEAAGVRARIRALEASEARRADAVDAPDTPEAKVALFRSLFRGRDDVFPRY